MRISPSILAADLTDLKRVLATMDPGVVDLLHLDVMDGHFVPQLSFGEAYARSVKAGSGIPLDVHLMVSRPELEIPKYFDLDPYVITFHIEATHFPIRLAQLIRERGLRAGASLNPGTPIERLAPVLDYLDLVLLMSVEPGFYGQKFIETSYERVRALKALIGDRPVEIQIDGGVNDQNIGRLGELGVDIAVAGSYCFSGGDVNARVKQLKAACGAHV
jgi:ribulose-phosphate 3-epimerase